MVFRGSVFRDFFMAGKYFSCDLHNSKKKFFGSLNGILSKLGASSPPGLSLSLIASHCTPTMLYALEALKLKNKEISSLSYAYNASFVKIFGSFDQCVIAQCQFHCGFLPFSYQIDACHHVTPYNELQL